MPLLDGFLIVSSGTPAFLVPVFVDHPGSNRSSIQEIGNNNRISSFFDVEVGNSYEVAKKIQSINVGDFALWAFRFIDGEIIQGTTIELLPTLNERLRQGQFRDFPLIESQVADFCEDRTARGDALAKAFAAIETQSNVMARIWRDSIILLPVAKAELAKLLPERLRPQVHMLRLVGEGGQIRLELPPDIFGRTELQIPGELKQTIRLGHVFGLQHLTVVRADTARSSSTIEPEFDDPYGESRSLTSIGDVVLRNGPSYSPDRLHVPPWIGTRGRPRRDPLLSFFIVNTDQKKLDEALRAAQRKPRSSVKVAIVTLPVTFGTR